MSQGLPKQTLRVPFGGLDTETVAKLVTVGSSLALENCVFDHLGQLVLRDGAVNMSVNTQPISGTPPPAWTLATRQGSLLRLAVPGPDALEAYAPTDQAWARPSGAGPALSSGQRGSIVVTPRTVARSSVAGLWCGTPDVAVGNGYAVASHNEPDNVLGRSVYEQIIDLASGTALFSRQISTAHESIVSRTIVVGHFACVVYSQASASTGGADLKIDIFDLTVIGFPVTVTVPSTTLGGPIDLIANLGGGSFRVAYIAGASGTLGGVDVTPSTGSAGTPFSILDQSGSGITPIAFAWGQDFSGSLKQFIVTADATNGLAVQWDLRVSGLNIAATTTFIMDASASAKAIAIPSTTGLWNLCAYTLSANSAGEFVVIYDQTSAISTSVSQGLKIVVLNAATEAVDSGVIKQATRFGGVTSISTILRGVALKSKPWQQNGLNYAMVATNNALSLQWTNYIVQLTSPFGTTGATGAPLARCQTQRGTGITEQPSMLPSVAALSATSWLVATSAQGDPREIISNAPPTMGFYFDTVIDLDTISFSVAPETTLGSPREAVESLFVPGGQLNQFDGSTYGETGFAYAPEPIAVTAGTDGGGGLTPSTEYFYAAVYGRTDLNGRTWRSAPSPFTSGTTSAGTNDSVSKTLAVRNLRLTGWGTEFIEIYRSPGGVAQDQAGDPTVMQLLAVLQNDPTQATQTYEDVLPDTSLVFNTFLYTTGGILQADLIPGALHVAVADNRVWFVSAEDPQLLYFSDTIQPRAGLKFNLALTLDVRDQYGPITGLASLNGQLCALKGNALYLLYGTGPDGAGNGSSYQMQQTMTGVGTKTPRSIVETTDGAWFRSDSTRAGFYRLNRGAAAEYVGQGVRDFNGLTVTAGVLVPSKSQLRFYTAEGTTLVYDLASRQWSTFTGQGAVAASLLGSVVAYATSSAHARGAGFIQLETVGTYSEGTLSGPTDFIAYNMRIVTPWLSLADLKGFERIYRFLGAGQTVGDHLLTTNVYRNLNDADLVQSTTPVLITAAAFPTWNWQLRPKVQKLSAAKLEFVLSSYTTVGQPPTAGAKVAGMTASWGQKVGLQKGAATRRLT